VIFSTSASKRKMFSAKRAICSLSYVLLFVGAHAEKKEVDKKQQQQFVQVYYDRTSCPIISPNGVSYLFGQGFPQVGDKWPFYGPLFNGPFGVEIGTLNQLCIRTSVEFWLCDGVITLPQNGRGSIAFKGTFDNNALTGNYIITGGSQDYLSRIGEVQDGFDQYPYERRIIQFF